MQIFQSAGQILKFIDFEPSENLVGQAVAKISRVFGESPSDASAKGFLRKTREGFEGRLQIHSAVGTFVADVIGDDPLGVLDSLSFKIRSQLQAWKSTRTLDD